MSKLSSGAFQAVYASNLKAYDVFVNFFAETTDRYGNKKNDVIISLWN